MVDRRKIEDLRVMLQGVKALALEEGEEMLCYLIQVAEQEAEDVLSGRFMRGTQVEEFAPTTLQ
jgi:hypothetical protein